MRVEDRDRLMDVPCIVYVGGGEDANKGTCHGPDAKCP